MYVGTTGKMFQWLGVHGALDRPQICFPAHTLCILQPPVTTFSGNSHTSGLGQLYICACTIHTNTKTFVIKVKINLF